MTEDEPAASTELTAMLRSDGELVLRPIILTRIVGHGIEVDFPMLVDTGADDIVLPESVALDFGLNLLDGETVQRGMLQGTAFGYRFAGFHIGFASYFEGFSFPTSITFTSRLNSTGHGLFGREPLLDHVWFRFGNDAGHVFRFGPLNR